MYRIIGAVLGALLALVVLASTAYGAVFMGGKNTADQVVATMKADTIYLMDGDDRAFGGVELYRDKGTIKVD